MVLVVVGFTTKAVADGNIDTDRIPVVIDAKNGTDNKAQRVVDIVFIVVDVDVVTVLLPNNNEEPMSKNGYSLLLFMIFTIIYLFSFVSFRFVLFVCQNCCCLPSTNE